MATAFGETDRWRTVGDKLSVGVLGSRRRRYGRSFCGGEAAFFVRAVTERFIFRLATAAKGDRGLIGRDGKGIAGGIDDRDRPFDKQRAIIANFDRDLRHHGFLD
jgi:hypothetical protein